MAARTFDVEVCTSLTTDPWNARHPALGIVLAVVILIAGAGLLEWLNNYKTRRDGKGCLYYLMGALWVIPAMILLYQNKVNDVSLDEISPFWIYGPVVGMLYVLSVNLRWEIRQKKEWDEHKRKRDSTGVE